MLAYAYRVARNGDCWLQIGRDRDRFKRRIHDIHIKISYVLSDDHRQKMLEMLQNKNLEEK